ncbi:MAG: GTP-binding protein [Lentilactobacillus hilgardii]|uniref:CobW family GTP-binding protein n=1 Tax=Lentilactobacillus hilgardii TaxID=1588 RepID=UPI001CC1DBF4|nr:GTP-binding protein [Lentilactobacillus hilgardii]MBZ2201519.1 cobalamin biosynthesis protein CobW [Lentilactobacillus hilgardii]MBZ2204437.1 cobalamin biosynthesis protein CobW [Lentilactobacillus hilgardii]
MDNRIPVTVISGYLGAGKTTLILHLLKCKEHRRVGIIVNDLAAVNVDEKMIEKNPYFSQADRLIALTNGSISGNLRQRLVDAVYDLAASGDVDLILIESSGIVQPDMVAKFISRGKNTDGRRLSDSCRLDTNVTIVDGFRVLQQFMPGIGEYNQDFTQSNQLIINQIEFCDVLLFNKTDLLTNEQQLYLKKFIRQLQPRAKFLETRFAVVPVSKVVNTRLFDEKTELKDYDRSDDLSHFSEHHDLKFGIESFVYRRRRPFNPKRFNDWLDQWPPEITRCKGVMWLITQPERVFNISQSGRAMDIIPSGYWIASMKKWEIKKMFTVRKHLREIWDERFGDRMIELVFIGQNMNKETIIHDLDACLMREDEVVTLRDDPFRLTYH